MEDAGVVMLRCGGGQNGDKCGRGTGDKAMGMAGMVRLGPHISIAHGGSSQADPCTLHPSWVILLRFLPCR